MNQKYITFMLLLLLGSSAVQAQIGIGVATPNSSAILETSSTTKGVLPPRLTTVQRENITKNSSIIGLTIYNTDKKCLETYNGSIWYNHCGDQDTAGTITAITCTSPTNTGTLIAGVATYASDVTTTIPYTGGTGGYYDVQKVASTGITGLTATLLPGNFVPGDGSLTYTITGTPSAAGTATFAFTVAGQNCTFTRTVDAGTGTITAITCAAPTTNLGTLVSGVVASGVSSVIAYTGGNGGSYDPQAIASSTGGVTGLTANLSGGNFTAGAGTLNFSITGTPSSNGTATFTFTVGGQSCSFTRTVDAAPIPATITLGQSGSYSIASIYDDNYFPYSIPTGSATITRPVNPDATKETLIELQGKLTTAGVTLGLPVTATGSGTLPAYSTTITIDKSFTEENTTNRDVTLSWAAQPYTSTTTYITATIAAVGSDLNAKKLDINAGLGSDYKGVLMGSIPYPYNSAGTTTNFELRDIPGIPDKMFDSADNSGLKRHNFLYIPVTAANGSIWLNNNLGAAYTDTSSPSFNIQQQATSSTDYLAYGSLFQWGRKPDGHELMNYTSSTAGTPVNTATTTTIATSSSPTHANFILPSGTPYDWLSPKDDTLWATATSANNPCPSSFRVATKTEFESLNITNSSTAYNTALKLSNSGGRNLLNSLINTGTIGFYWASNFYNTYAFALTFNSVSSQITYVNANRALGLSVRCLKDNTPIGTITAINCAAPTTNSGTLVSGVVASGVSSVISYTGGNGGSYAPQAIDSTTGGVTGLTANLSGGNFASGTGTLNFSITGTPSSNGTATFTFTVGGQSCSFTRTVDAAPIPATITLGQSGSYSIASIYDENYLPYSLPTGSATTTRPVNPVGDTTNETLIDVQGTITTAGITTVTIPVTATGSGTLPAYSKTITIDKSFTEENTTNRDVTLSWAAQPYTSTTTYITATIAAVGSDLNAKKLDLNAGLGSDYKGVLMGSIPYPYNSAGATTTFELRDIPGIPDKMFGLADNSGSSTTHMMLYLPIVAADGNIWLNNNLGAHYANINNGSFNLSKQATSATDYLAYGSLFQWGRKPDGHELITYTSATVGTPVNGTTAVLSNAPVNALFIINPTLSSPYDWRTAQDVTLWTTAASANNPCPTGFRVPTIGELNTLITASGITNSTTAASSLMKFTSTGFRYDRDGSLNNLGNVSYYWSLSVSGIYAIGRYFTTADVYTYTGNRATGLSVRCLKN